MSLELMEFLNKINENISEIKERTIRIEAQDHSGKLAALTLVVEEERTHRINLEMKLTELKTRIAPILAGIAILSTVCLDYIIKRFH